MVVQEDKIARLFSASDVHPLFRTTMFYYGSLPRIHYRIELTFFGLAHAILLRTESGASNPAAFCELPSSTCRRVIMIIQAAKQTLGLETSSSQGEPASSAPSSPSAHPPMNPGRPLRTKNTGPGWKFVIWTAGFAVLLFVSKWVLDTVTSILNLHSPHAELKLYRPELSMAEVKNPKSVVQPLFDEDQVFDVAVVVWARTVDPASGWPWDGNAATPGTPKPTTYYDHGRALLFPASGAQVGSVLHAPSTWMKSIYADVPRELSGLRHSDLERVRTSVLSLPIPKDLLYVPYYPQRVLCAPNLRNSCNRLVRPNDLLAAFTLLPVGSFKAENTTGLSSYLPEDVFSRFALLPDE